MPAPVVGEQLGLPVRMFFRAGAGRAGLASGGF